MKPALGFAAIAAAAAFLLNAFFTRYYPPDWIWWSVGGDSPSLGGGLVKGGPAMLVSLCTALALGLLAFPKGRRNAAALAAVPLAAGLALPGLAWLYERATHLKFAELGHGMALAWLALVLLFFAVLGRFPWKT